MGSCGSESGTFEMLLAGPGQILDESHKRMERGVGGEGGRK